MSTKKHKKKVRAKKTKTIEDVFKAYDEFMKTHEHNGATKKDFKKVLKKAVKPSSK